MMLLFDIKCVRQAVRAYYVMPPPALPHPPANALADPTTFLSKKPVVQTWHGTKTAPRIPTKNRNTIRPAAFVTKPAIAVGRAPINKRLAYTFRGPHLSQAGPASARATRLNLY